MTPGVASRPRLLRAWPPWAAPLRRLARTLLLIFRVMGTVALGAAAAPAPEEPGGLVDSLGRQALGLLAEYHENEAPKYRAELKQIIRDNFDLEWDTRFVIGGYWQNANPRQQAELLTLIPDYATEIAARVFFNIKARDVDSRRFLNWSFRVLGSQPIDATERVVLSEVKVGGIPFRIGWRVRAEGGRLRIVDATIQGVSAALTLRQSLESLIARKGLDGLVDEVRSKLAQLRAEGR